MHHLMHPLIFPHIQRQAIQLEFCYERFFGQVKNKPVFKRPLLSNLKGHQLSNLLKLKKGICRVTPIPFSIKK